MCLNGIIAMVRMTIDKYNLPGTWLPKQCYIYFRRGFMLDISTFRVAQGAHLKLSHASTDDSGKYQSEEEAHLSMQANINEMIKLQNKLYAEDSYGLLIIFQAMDAAGKDGAIKHVTSGLNPQGTMVHSFKIPCLEEMNHDCLWRYSKCLPERGQIGIFNRSYYEEVLVARVHNLVINQKIPKEFINPDIWQTRLRHIANFEEYLTMNGITIIKFFLHISKDEQRKRLLQRIDDPNKNWKFSEDDLQEREYWDDYAKCYQEAIMGTSTKYAPWYVVPSDKKWFSRLVISEVIVQTLNNMKLKYPQLDKKQLIELETSKNKLLQD
jgi:PPK2 family polyphosphate:nucleotide phosphotransferase